MYINKREYLIQNGVQEFGSVQTIVANKSFFGEKSNSFFRLALGM